MQRTLRVVGYVILLVMTGCSSAPRKTTEEIKPKRQPLTTQQRDQLLTAVKTLHKLTVEGHAGAVKAGFEQVKADLPQIAEFDLKLFARAEVYMAGKKFDHAAKAYAKMVDEYPESELRDPALDRLFTIGSYYLQGPVILHLVLFPIRGYDKGIKILDDVSEEVGLEDPNGLGIKAAMAVARCHEHRRLYEEAYLKWSEIATVWEVGPLGKEALLGMAQSKLHTYNNTVPQRRHLYDGSNLTAARGYYVRFKDLYPTDANEMNVNGIITQIDRDIATKQLAIGRYYNRIGKTQAANLYYNMVIQNWPQTPAAQTAREILMADKSSSKVR